MYAMRFALILASSAIFCFLLLSLFRSVADVGILRTHFPKVVYDARTETSSVEIVKKAPPGWVAYSQISPIARDAIVISEDAAFWTHNGFDWNQLWDAFQTNLHKGRFVRGGSTITQQVIKNVFLTKEKTILRKVAEAILTMRIERHVSKKRILEIYLNVAEMGPGVYGIGNASVYYFRHSAATLTPKEGAFLAMLLPSPKRYGISFRKKYLTPFARDAIRGILMKLAAVHKLSEAAVQQELATPLAFEASQIPSNPAVAAPPVPDDEEEEPDTAPAPVGEAI
jgi:monofunctional biosynthetic peptidoglycan transglycosylase